MAKSSGSALAAIALIIALGAAGLGVYQMFFAPPGTITYVSKWENPITLSATTTTVPVNLTFNTKAGDVVLLEFTGYTRLVIVGGVSSIALWFYVDSAIGLTISKLGYSGEDSQDIYDSCSMRDYITDFSAGTHIITVQVNCDDLGSQISDCVLSATIIR
jgi:hypothetical protein